MITIKQIKRDVEVLTGLEDISRKTREQEYVFSRYLYFSLARRFTSKSLDVIGGLMNQDHSNVVHGINVFKRDRRYMKEQARIYNDLKAKYIGYNDNPDAIQKLLYVRENIEVLEENKLDEIIEIIKG